MEPAQVSWNATCGSGPFVKRSSTDLSAVDRPFGGSQLNWKDEIHGTVPQPPSFAAGLGTLQVPFNCGRRTGRSEYRGPCRQSRFRRRASQGSGNAKPSAGNDSPQKPSTIHRLLLITDPEKARCRPSGEGIPQVKDEPFCRHRIWARPSMSTRTRVAASGDVLPQ